MISDVQRVVAVDEHSTRSSELPPLLEELAVLIENLNAVIATIADEEAPARVHREGVRSLCVKIARRAPLLSPRLDEFSVLRKLHDARVRHTAVAVADEDIAVRGDEDRGRHVEGIRTVARNASLAERHQELPVQNYEADDQPIAKWYLAIPPAGTDELGRARSQAEDSINKWQQQATQTFSDMTAVSTWIGARETEQAGTALVVLSHHADDRLYFSPKDQLTADEIARRFMRPAIAILDGCGTGAAAGRLIQNLNNAGFGAVIATATPVDSEIAGDFLACMAETLDRNRDDATFNLSLAFSDAVRCVRDDKDHRARALTWLMLGNGSLRLTSPHKQP